MGCSEIMRNLGELIMNNKLVTFLSVALFAFVITVIALAVSNNNNASDLDDCRAEVTRLLALTSTAAPTWRIVGTAVTITVPLSKRELLDVEVCSDNSNSLIVVVALHGNERLGNLERSVARTGIEEIK
uniref:Uncharacterized protein n=1 Tax=Anopheles culicifacies TaxID=139723 RepID=A0A182M935_9DIPT